MSLILGLHVNKHLCGVRYCLWKGVGVGGEWKYGILSVKCKMWSVKCNDDHDDDGDDDAREVWNVNCKISNLKKF